MLDTPLDDDLLIELGFSKVLRTTQKREWQPGGGVMHSIERVIGFEHPDAPDFRLDSCFDGAGEPLQGYRIGRGLRTTFTVGDLLSRIQTPAFVAGCAQLGYCLPPIEHAPLPPL